MIDVQDFEDIFKRTGTGYFINDIQYVPDIKSWAREKDQDLGEPHHPMKLISGSGDTLTMVVQSKISQEMVDDVIKNLSIRWAVKDTMTDVDRKLNSMKKRLLFCFLKERARTMKGIGGNELVEDQWVFDEMESLGFFDEHEDVHES